MPGIELGSGFNWGPIRTGVEQMRSFVNQSTAGIQKDIASMFTPAGVGGLISVAAIEGGISRIIEYGDKISDLAKRFGVSTTALQQFGNVAERNGSSLDAVAAAFNKLEISRSKALGGNKSVEESFAKLNVTFDDLKKLTPEQLLLKIGSSSMNAADMVKVLTKGALGLRETLAGLADGTEEFGKAMSPGAIAAADDLSDRLKLLKENATAAFGPPVLAYVSQFVSAIKAMGPDLADFYKRLFGGEGLVSSFKSAFFHPEPSKRSRSFGGAGSAITGEEDIDEVSRRGGGAGTTASLQDRIAKLSEEHAAKARTDQQQLNALLQKGSELYYAQAAAVGDQDEELKTRLAYLENQKQIDELTAKIAKEKLETESKITAERVKAANDADQNLARAQAETHQYELRAKGLDDMADRQKIIAEFEEKITKAEQAANDAREKGFADVARTNEELADQLVLERNAALAAHDKARAEKEAEEAAALHAQDLKESLEIRNQDIPQAKGRLLDLREQRAEQDLINAGLFDEADKLHQNWEWQKQINDATAEANAAWRLMDQAYSEGKNLLADQYAQLARINEATAHELELQKQISEQRRHQLEWSRGMQNLANNLATHSVEDLTVKVGDRRAAPGDPASILAINPFTGVIDPTKLKYYQDLIGGHAIGGIIAQQVKAQEALILQNQDRWGLPTGGGTRGGPWGDVMPLFSQMLNELKSIDARLVIKP